MFHINIFPKNGNIELSSVKYSLYKKNMQILYGVFLYAIYFNSNNIKNCGQLFLVSVHKSSSPMMCSQYTPKPCSISYIISISRRNMVDMLFLYISKWLKSSKHYSNLHLPTAFKSIFVIYPECNTLCNTECNAVCTSWHDPYN